MSDSRESSAPEPALPVSLPLVTRRRQRGQLFQKVRHAVPAAALLMAGLQSLQHGERGFALALAIGEIAVSALLLRTLVKDFAAARRPHGAAEAGHHGGHSGIDWFDVFAAGVLAAEALEHWHTHHHLPGPTILLAAVTLTLGLLHGRIAHRRMLHIQEDGIRIGRRFLFFRRFDASCQDIERIDLDDKQAQIVLRNGKTWRTKLTGLPNAPDIRAALLAARSRLSPPALPTPGT